MIVRILNDEQFFLVFIRWDSFETRTNDTIAIAKYKKNEKTKQQ